MGHIWDPLFQGVAGFDLAEFGICSQGWSKRGPKMTPKPAPGGHPGDPIFDPLWQEIPRFLRVLNVEPLCTLKYGVPEWVPGAVLGSFWDPFLTTPGPISRTPLDQIPLPPEIGGPGDGPKWSFWDPIWDPYMARCTRGLRLKPLEIGVFLPRGGQKGVPKWVIFGTPF